MLIFARRRCNARAVMLGAGVLSFVATAQGGLVRQEVQSKPWQLPLSPNSLFLDFDQFDAQGGRRHLIRADLRFTVSSAVDMTVENHTPFAVNEFTITHTAFATVRLGTLKGAVSMLHLAGPVALAPTDDGGVGDGQGPDFFDFGTLQQTGFTIDIGGTQGFVGQDTVTAVVHASATINVSSIPGTIRALNHQAFGAVTLVYTYVPAPGVAACPLVALLVSGRRRR